MHELAMEFVDEAQFAKRKGELNTSKLFLQKALALEKFVAIGFPRDEKYDLTRSVFFRSAIPLAIDCASYQEAIELAGLALSSNPHDVIVPEIKELVQIAQEKQEEKVKYKELTGRLIAADISKNQIKLQMDSPNQMISIQVAKELLHQIVKAYWEKVITVESTIQSDGSTFLRNIRQAA